MPWGAVRCCGGGGGVGGVRCAVPRRARALPGGGPAPQIYSSPPPPGLPACRRAGLRASACRARRRARGGARVGAWACVPVVPVPVSSSVPHVPLPPARRPPPGPTPAPRAAASPHPGRNATCWPPRARVPIGPAAARSPRPPARRRPPIGRLPRHSGRPHGAAAQAGLRRAGPPSRSRVGAGTGRARPGVTRVSAAPRVPAHGGRRGRTGLRRARAPAARTAAWGGAGSCPLGRPRGSGPARHGLAQGGRLSVLRAFSGRAAGKAPRFWWLFSFIFFAFHPPPCSTQFWPYVCRRCAREVYVTAPGNALAICPSESGRINE